jgi:PAS domain S-box-containing protein
MAIVDAVAAGCPVIQVNSAFERSFGIPETEARGRPFSTALCRGDRDAAQKLFESGGVQAALLVWRKDGTQLQVEASVGPVHDVKGTRTHWVVTFAHEQQDAVARSAPQPASAPATRG